MSLHWPNRVWEKGPKGWSSRAVTEDDRKRRSLVDELFQSNPIKVTKEKKDDARYTTAHTS